jgi:hypothetical protein
VTLVVVDGTWWQARKVIRENPELAALPRYSFTPPAPSEYRIRKEPHEAYVSTIEALVHVLGALEADPERFRALLTPFRAMIDMQIACEQRLGGLRPRHKKVPRPPRRRAPRALAAHAGDLVCVVGEANAWPYGSAERGHACADELVHWVACRPGTGETFERVVAPRNPLAPRTPSYVALPEEVLRAGGSLSALHRGWRAFVRETDVVCSWGTYATSLFVAEGGTLPATHLDLRRLSRVFAGGKVGTLDDFLARNGIPSPPRLAAGRAGMRLGQVVELARFLGQAAVREDAAFAQHP